MAWICITQKGPCQWLHVSAGCPTIDFNLCTFCRSSHSCACRWDMHQLITERNQSRLVPTPPLLCCFGRSITPVVYLALLARDDLALIHRRWGSLLGAVAPQSSSSADTSRSLPDLRLLLALSLVTLWAARLTFNFWRKGGYNLRSVSVLTHACPVSLSCCRPPPPCLTVSQGIPECIQGDTHDLSARLGVYSPSSWSGSGHASGTIAAA